MTDIEICELIIAQGGCCGGVISVACGGCPHWPGRNKFTCHDPAAKSKAYLATHKRRAKVKYRAVDSQPGGALFLDNDKYHVIGRNGKIYSKQFSMHAAKRIAAALNKEVSK